MRADKINDVVNITTPAIKNISINFLEKHARKKLWFISVQYVQQGPWPRGVDSFLNPEGLAVVWGA